MTNLNFLSNCKQTQYLDIGLESGNNTRIISILPLEGITTLTRFLAPGNGITSLEPIKNSVNLKVLDVANNELNPTNTMTTTAVLTGFANLEELYIGGNIKLNNIDFLNTVAARSKLKRLNIGELSINASVVESYVSQLSKLEWLQLYKLNLTSCVFLGFVNLPNLRYLKISHNSITNFLPVMHVSVLVTDYNDIRQD
jgi:Leucine-rich repeat (LRR) protein